MRSLITIYDTVIVLHNIIIHVLHISYHNYHNIVILSYYKISYSITIIAHGNIYSSKYTTVHPLYYMNIVVLS